MPWISMRLTDDGWSACSAACAPEAAPRVPGREEDHREVRIVDVRRLGRQGISYTGL